MTPIYIDSNGMALTGAAAELQHDIDLARFEAARHFIDPWVYYPGAPTANAALTWTEAAVAEQDEARQTRVESMVEVAVNTTIGFAINYTANLLILPLFGFTSLTPGTNFLIGMLYTVISVGRSYVIRRWAQDNLRRMNTAIAKRIKGFFA